MDMIDSWVAELNRSEIKASTAPLRLCRQHDLMLAILRFQVDWCLSFRRESGISCKGVADEMLGTPHGINEALARLVELRRPFAAPEPGEQVTAMVMNVVRRTCGQAGVAALNANFDRMRRRALAAIWAQPSGDIKPAAWNAAIDACAAMEPYLADPEGSMPLLNRGSYVAASVARVAGGERADIVEAARRAAVNCAVAIAARNLAAEAWAVGVSALSHLMATGHPQWRIDAASRWLRSRARRLGQDSKAGQTPPDRSASASAHV